MTSKLRFLLVCATLFLASCDGKGDDQAAQGGAPGAGMPPPTVTVAKPTVQPINEWREFSGRFEAPETVEIRSRVSGYLTSIAFKDGAIVKKGDLLFTIDPRPYEAALRQKQADLALAQSKVTAAENDYQRALTLFKSGDISDQLLDQRRAAKDSIKASVDSAKAAVESARLDVSYTKITSPIDGRISRKLVSEGNLVNPGETLLTTIVSIDPIYFYFDVDEKAYVAYSRATTGADKDHSNPGLPVSVALTDEKDFTHEGVIDFIDNQLDGNTGTMRGRAVFENKDMLMTPGMFGKIRIRVGGSDSGVLIPDAAIMVDQTRKLVMVVDDKNMVASRTIETGTMDNGLRIVTKGLDGSETIIINGLQRAHEGAPVTPQTQEQADAAAQAAKGTQPQAPGAH